MSSSCEEGGLAAEPAPEEAREAATPERPSQDEASSPLPGPLEQGPERQTEEAEEAEEPADAQGETPLRSSGKAREEPEASPGGTVRYTEEELEDFLADRCRWTIFEDAEDEIRHLRRRGDVLAAGLRAAREEVARLHGAGVSLQEAYEALQQEFRQVVGDTAYWRALAEARAEDLAAMEEAAAAAAAEVQAPAPTEEVRSGAGRPQGAGPGSPAALAAGSGGCGAGQVPAPAEEARTGAGRLQSAGAGAPAAAGAGGAAGQAASAQPLTPSRSSAGPLPPEVASPARASPARDAGAAAAAPEAARHCSPLERRPEPPRPEAVRRPEAARAAAAAAAAQREAEAKMDSREALRAAAAEAAQELEARRCRRLLAEQRGEDAPGRPGGSPGFEPPSTPTAGGTPLLLRGAAARDALAGTPTADAPQHGAVAAPGAALPLPPPLPPAFPAAPPSLAASGPPSGHASPPVGSPQWLDTGSTMSLVSCSSVCSGRSGAAGGGAPAGGGAIKPRALFAQATPTPVANLRKWGPGSAPRRCPGLGTPTRRSTAPPSADHGLAPRASSSGAGASSGLRGSSAAAAAAAAAGVRRCRSPGEGQKIAALVDLWESKRRPMHEEFAEAAC